MNKIGVAILGIGTGRNGFGLGPYLLKTLSNNSEVNILAVGGRSKRRLKESLTVIEKKGRPKILLFSGKELDSIFDIKEVQLIIIATPDHSHLEFVKKAIYAKKHVLVEKPIFKFPLSAKNKKEVNPIFLFAEENNLLLSTLCQRALIAEKIEETKIKKLKISMSFGAKKRELSPREFYQACISHPISILTKLKLKAPGLIEVNYKKAKEARFVHYFEILLKIELLNIEIILVQKSYKEAAKVELMVNDTKWAIDTLSLDNNFITSIHKEDVVCLEEDFYKQTVDRVINYLKGTVSCPLISTAESLCILELEELFNNALPLN
ncbi:MAG: Gfo/Idh/MocA family oxidoreductase [Chitinophagales bacterium]|nr:Gfo/Idh/MocA family oxidoreductase [Chitinophagales bacterium]